MSLTDGTLQVGVVRWSPDGSQLVYVARDFADNVDDMYTVSADGTNNIQRREDIWGADWTPDGSKILFLRASGLWELDLSDDSERLLISIPGSLLRSFDVGPAQ